jgi:hypothetical protein
MTTLGTKSGLKRQTDADPSAPSVAPASDTSTLITEQQVMLGSAAALAPAPSHRWSHPAHEVAVAVHAMFARPEKLRAGRGDYAQRFGYLENSLVAREMSRGM